MITDFGSAFEYANGIAIQPDGKIVAAGFTTTTTTTGKGSNTTTTSSNDFAVARYLGDTVAALHKAGANDLGSTRSARGLDPMTFHLLTRPDSGTASVFVDAVPGGPDGEQQSRIRNAIAMLNNVLAPVGVELTVTDDAYSATIRVHHAGASVCGGTAEGVLGCANESGDITLIEGWNWYTGAEASSIAQDQYDYQTAVTHELLHLLGYEHSGDPSSVTHDTLRPGATRRALPLFSLAGGDREKGLARRGKTKATNNDRCGIIDPAVALEERFPQTSKPLIDSEKVVNERSARWMLNRFEHDRGQRRGNRAANASQTSRVDLDKVANAAHAESLPRILTRVADAHTTRDLSDLRASAIESGLDADFLKDLAAVL